MGWDEVQNLLREADTGSHGQMLKAVSSLRDLDFAWTDHASIYFLRNFTVEPVEPFVRLACYRRGIQIDLGYSDFDTYQQEIADLSSTLHQKPPSLVVLALWLDQLSLATDSEGRLQPTAVINHMIGLIAQLKERLPSLICLNTFLPPAHHVDVWKGIDPLSRGIDEINGEIAEYASKDPRILLVDFGKLVGQLGVEDAIDPRFRFMFASPFRTSFLRLWGDTLGRAIASGLGLAKKVLVLDCDNTLWGGIIGEDGIQGIDLDPHNYPGNVYYVFQKQILQLQSQGVLVVLCSKNNEADVLDVLDNHPDCLIGRKFLTAWQINWSDKVTGINALAKELNLGLESFVFVDDSPVECGFVRQALPMVEVLQIPSDIYNLPKLLQDYNGFYGLLTSKEDAVRTSLYQTEQERRAQGVQYNTLEDYLASLELVAEIGLPEQDELPRVAQLTQKTNQFNLTTQRYGLGDIERFSVSENHQIYVMKVSDKYGEYGLTGVALAVLEENQIRIDTFLMSCRVLGRRLEDVFLLEVLLGIKNKWKEDSVILEYIQTSKNDQVRGFLDKAGLECLDTGDDRKVYRALLKTQSINSRNFIDVKRR